MLTGKTSVQGADEILRQAFGEKRSGRSETYWLNIYDSRITLQKFHQTARKNIVLKRKLLVCGIALLGTACTYFLIF